MPVNMKTGAGTRCAEGDVLFPRFAACFINSWAGTPGSWNPAAPGDLNSRRIVRSHSPARTARDCITSPCMAPQPHGTHRCLIEPGSHSTWSSLGPSHPLVPQQPDPSGHLQLLPSCGYCLPPSGRPPKPPQRASGKTAAAQPALASKVYQHHLPARCGLTRSPDMQHWPTC